MVENPRCRCAWADPGKPAYVQYHDQEWGWPVFDDRKLFEFLVLESAQAGLSWYTVLRKRENYRRAFDGFDPHAVAGYNNGKVQQLLTNAGIIRNRRKIESAINNARQFLDVQKDFGSFAGYIWQFVDGIPIVNAFKHHETLPAFTPISKAMAHDLRQRGFQFLGPTICYAFMQATGMVNDHVVECFVRDKIIAAYPHKPAPTT